MKKLLFLLSLAVLLCGCSEKTVSTSEELVESTTASEIHTKAETTTAVTTKISETTTKPAPVGRLTYTVNENGISLKMDGKAVPDIELGYSPKSDYISAGDFDFDGYQDIFIPFEDSYREGCYYRYDPDTEQFESWDMLNEIGYVMETDGDDTLLLKMYSMTGEKYFVYKWTNDELCPVLLSNYYYTSEGATDDYYEYSPDGSKILFERHLINLNNGVRYKTYVREELVYFSVKADGIDVLRDGKVLQTIEGDYLGELDLAARRVYSEMPVKEIEYLDKYGFYVPEDFLKTTDFNFDGYPDLFIPTDHLSDTGVYYRFDPETELFEEWDELNRIGESVYTENEDEALIFSRYDADRREAEKCVYQWENDSLVRVSRELTYYGEDGELYTDHFDSTGTLVKREHLLSDGYSRFNKTEEVEIN